MEIFRHKLGIKVAISLLIVIIQFDMIDLLAGKSLLPVSVHEETKIDVDDDYEDASDNFWRIRNQEKNRVKTVYVPTFHQYSPTLAVTEKKLFHILSVCTPIQIHHSLQTLLCTYLI